MGRLVFVSIFLAAAGLARAQTATLDPNIAGLWINTTQIGSKTPAQTNVILLYPSGIFTELLEQPGPNTPIDLSDNKGTTSSCTGTYTAANGSLNLSPTQGTMGPRSYVLCDDHSRMILKINSGGGTFLFCRYGTTTQKGGWNGITNWSEAAASLSCMIPPDGKVANLDLAGTAHWVDVGLAGVWVSGSQPTAANPNPQVSIWLIHPDGSYVMHRQTISATQPMDPNSSAHDTSTSSANVDIFGGCFCFSSNGTSFMTGVYTLGSDGNQLSITPAGATSVAFTRAGYFNLDGSASLQ
jgi:hypothetical protein